ncbi:MAG: hypothetical protein AB8C46_05670 [Burkholderiaceae bacterium]
MAFRKIIEKLDDYYARLDAGKAKQIKPKHVFKVIAKLSAKITKTKHALAETEKGAKKERLERKLLIAQEHLKRAEWLVEKIQSGKNR